MLAVVDDARITSALRRDDGAQQTDSASSWRGGALTHRPGVERAACQGAGIGLAALACLLDPPRTSTTLFAA